MRLAYLDASAGVSGDMLLGAFVQAGVPVELLEHTLATLSLGATLRVEAVDRSGIHACKVTVLADGKPAEDEKHAPGGGHDHSHGEHDHGHLDHSHESGTTARREVRSLSVIRELISRADLAQPVKTQAIRAFELLGAAEAKIHHVPIELIHFHEVGAVDAIADIVLASAAAHELGIEAWSCSPLNVGGGTVQCAHGHYPVPAPATAELLRGAPTYSSGIQLELVTPTGAALVRSLDCTFGGQPLMEVKAIGYGAGSRNPEGFANVVRLSVGQQEESATNADSVVVLELALDDLNPQVIAYVMEEALKLGALDVMSTPVQMKKNRQGTLLTVLSDHHHAKQLEDFLLRETSTLGLRMREERRVCLERRHVQVQTEWGTVRVKIGSRGRDVLNVAPEYEDCRALAQAREVPLKRVLEAALQAYRQENS